MTNQEVNQLTTIVIRYTEVNSAAKQARLAIQEVKNKLFTNFISKEDEEVLIKAMQIVEQIGNNTQQADAVKYYNQIMTTNEFIEINHDDVLSPKYYDNIRKYGEHSDTCFICGKRTASGKWVHYTTRGKLTNNPNHEHTQGYFPIGNECAKKLPKSFVTTF